MPTPTAVIRWTSHGPGGAPINALAIDPTTPRTLYAGMWGGSVFKSTDGADTWEAVNTTLPNVTRLVIDPITLGTLYATTDRGVFKSTDGAIEWQAANSGLPDSAPVVALAIDLSTPRTLYAATDSSGFGGVFKSTDGAGSWHAVNNGLPGYGVNALAINPIAPTTLYAATDAGIYKSTDGGGVWAAFNVGLNGARIVALAIDPLTPGTLYSGTDRGGLSGCESCVYGVFKSTDSGSSWSATALVSGSAALVIDPKTPSILYAGTYNGVFKSTDSAASWQPLNAGLPDSPILDELVIDALVIDPRTPSKLYAGTYGGDVFSIQQSPAVKMVGTGTADSCTAAALETALDGGGLVTFDCGTDPVTIDVSTGTGTKTINADTTVDGGNLMTISGTTATVFSVNSGVNFIVENLTVANGSGDIEPAGGIVNNGGFLTVTNCIFDSNYGSVGGAIYSSSGGIVTITNSTFTGNSAGGGGAIADSNGSLTVTNCTFTGNSGDSAIFQYSGGLVAITNSTFTGNNATFGAIYVENGTVLLRNTILANAPSGNCIGVIDGGHNLDDGTSCGFSTANGSLSNTDPQLDPAGLQDNGGPTQTIALCTAVGVPAGCTAASPAIDAGDPDTCAIAPVNNRDQRGLVRPGTGHTDCSIGAYEADAGPPLCIGDCNDDREVSTDELVRGVRIALGTTILDQCPAFACDGNADMTVDCLVRAVHNALNGCGG